MTLDPRLTSALSDRYRLERELGAGGMATVYLAQDLKHDRKVAIKVLRPELAVVIGADRFLSEIRTTARLQHPHIVPLFDSGSIGLDGPSAPLSLLFYVMPYLDGESLRQRMSREPALSTEESVRLVREVADALGYAHAHGVVHRDIKPENIMLQSGHAVVADFGIARAMSVAGSDRVTQVGLALGTPAYMSPEQAAGERDVDGRTDQYALASVLYELLAGEPPFTGATVEAILVQRFTKPAPRLSVKRPAIARAIDAAISTAMARAPEDRFPSMSGFAAALEGAGDDGPLERSIAVLPFANMSGDPENEYFSDGISEEIINALTQLPGLRVAARTSAFSYKGRNVDLRTVGDQLDVATVLEGSVRKSAGRIRITAQLIKVADGYHLWSERYDRELTDVFAIQDEIAAAIAGKLQLTLGVEANRGRAPTANVEAYDLYLKGRALFKQRGPALPLAVECFEQASALDPGLALAYTGLADALLVMALYGMVSTREIGERARQATTRALELDPDLPSAQVVLGLYSLLVDFDRTRSAASFERAVDLDPSSVDARTIQAVLDYCYIRGDRRGAEAMIQAVIELDPRSANARAQAGIILTWSGKFDEAMAQAARGIEFDPGAFYPYWAHYIAQAAGPNPAQAVAAGPALLARFGRHPWLMMAMAYAAGRSGQRERAEALHAELLGRSQGEYVQPVALAISALAAGKSAESFAHLSEAARVKDPLLAVTILHWPLFDAIRGSAEFDQVLRSIGWDQPAPVR